MTAGDASLKIWNVYDGTNLGYVQYDNSSGASTSQLMDYEYTHAENFPKQLKVTLSNGEVGSTNLLSSSFAWSNGTDGPIDVGCYVLFQLQPTTSTYSAVQPIFFGTVTDVAPDASKLTLTLTCKELSQRLEGIKSNKVIFSNYRDAYIRPHSTTTAGDNYYAITGLTDTDIAAPFSDVEFASADTTIATFGGNTLAGASFAVGALAQEWINLDANALMGVRVYAYSGTPQTLNVALCNDSGSGYPGTVIASGNVTINGSSALYSVMLHDASGTGPVSITPGVTYWIKFDIGTTYSLAGICGDATNHSYTIDSLSTYSGSTWTALSSTFGSLSVYLDLANYETIDWKNCVWTPSTGIMIIKASSAVAGQAYTSTQYRGRVSYYYNVVSSASIATALTQLAQPLSTDIAFTPSVYSAYAQTYPLWKVGSNFVGASIRELCDNFCVHASGWMNYYQGAVGMYNSTWSPSGSNVMKWSRRLDINDAIYMSCSNPPASDAEALIVGFSNFRKTTKRPSSVFVVGKDTSGLPICAHRDDQELRMNSLQVLSRQFLTEYITDDNIQTLQQADAIARARLDLNALNVWEGEMTLSGTYPDLMDIDPTSNFYASGKTISITYPVIGLSSQAFHVKQVRVTPATTVVQLSNLDPLILNRYNTTYDSASRSQTLLAPTDTNLNVFAKFMNTATPILGMTFTMALLRADGTPITSQISTSWTWDMKRKTVIYHAEFEAGNGVTTDALATWVNQAELYFVGSPWVNSKLGPGYSFPKWSGTRVIVDFACWDGN